MPWAAIQSVIPLDILPVSTSSETYVIDDDCNNDKKYYLVILSPYVDSFQNAVYRQTDNQRMNGMKTATMVIYMTEVEEVCYTEARAMQTFYVRRLWALFLAFSSFVPRSYLLEESLSRRQFEPTVVFCLKPSTKLLNMELKTFCPMSAVQLGLFLACLLPQLSV